MQMIEEEKEHCHLVAKAVAIALGGIALVACGAMAVATNDSASVRSSGRQAADAKSKEKRAPESEIEHSKKEREKRLKMILLGFGSEANTNNITFSDLDLTGWEAEEKKGEEALMLFLEKVWERADAKKIAEKQKVKSN